MRYDLTLLAKRAMEARGLQPEFPQDALDQLEKIKEAAPCPAVCQDLRDLLWCSIDNDNSRDLDQLTFAEKEEEKTTLWIAIADVDALVEQESPLDLHAQFNTTSVYTPAKIFPMFPEKLSTNLTSLNEEEDRLALVVKIRMSEKGEIESSSIFHARVRNRAKLAYSSVGAWLEGKGALPEKIKRVSGLQEALQLQHEAAQKLKKRRHALGALTLEPAEIEATILENHKVLLEPPGYNYAHQLIEHFMIAANHAMATQLSRAQISSLRRIVRIPKRWDRIQQIAAELSAHLPEKPDSKALEAFLLEQKTKDPEGFPELSLTVIKLLGRGEYVVESPGDVPIGHFGLALSGYTHSTAPNRRFPDLITQRQYKAGMSGKNPYPLKMLQQLAVHCTEQEDAAAKVERQMTKSAAALLLSSRLGTVFQAMVTGAGPKGTWVRISTPPVEGKLIHGFDNLDVGHRVAVKLVSVDIPNGHINFAKR